jgi:hypothetical protein
MRGLVDVSVNDVCNIDECTLWRRMPELEIEHHFVAPLGKCFHFFTFIVFAIRTNLNNKYIGTF